MSQLADSIITGPLVFQTVPTEKAAALIYVPGLGWMEWAEVSGTGAFQGYRTLRCGALEFGTTTAPRSYEADLVGGLGSKTSQASIWAWAQQNGHAVAAAAWSTKVFKFADVDANTFRFPDLRDVFARFAGTDADTGQAVVLGSYKADTIKAHGHSIEVNSSAGSGSRLAAGTGTNGSGSIGTGATGSAETAPKHTAFAPRIHI
ncbi:hypothetical protein RB25_21945 [Herbaspirillum rubrisubalbicans]|uniref:hypothetical protein n=1 Tax=Herbaspirillum rubrisubalbicans TaxID=80842 RepID=UPI000DC4336F|nr:hypothetical protein [Herbaspirillum rubrisubalbicans]RAN43746.1 hypothetical protein RB25_21945 [Herbaspirillum rubrisubalbicans]